MPPKGSKAAATKKSPAKPGKSKATVTKAKKAVKTATITKKKAPPKKTTPNKAAPKTAAAPKKSTPQKAATPKKTAAKPKPKAAAPAAAAAAAATVAAGSKKPAAKKPSGPLKVGSDAPDFTVNDQDGAEVSLSSFTGEKSVVVFFYPKDNTPGCTKEACSFRDLKEEYDELDCVVLGVSADHETSHGKFIAKYSLNFSLLADTNRALIKAYGASKAGDKIQRSTVLIDKEGKVAAVWNPVSGAEKHPNEVLAKLKEMA